MKLYRVCGARDRTPDKAYSGKIPLRIPPDIHRAAEAAAKARGKSVNAWIAEAVKREIGGQIGRWNALERVLDSRVPERAFLTGRKIACGLASNPGPFDRCSHHALVDHS